MTDEEFIATYCNGTTSCPRCTGCGYGDTTCTVCADLIAEKRPGCWKCGGTGRVACEIDHDHFDPEQMCGTRVQHNGETCYWCEQIIEGADDGGCPNCWTPITTLADGKAMFAELGFDTVIEP